MQAVIMAGGKGTRLSSITGESIPKPMVSFCGKPILERAIMQLAENGIRDIVICVGYLADHIINYFSDDHVPKVQLHFIKEKEPLGTAGALAYAKDLITQDFVFVYGDLIFNVDLDRMHRFHQKREAFATLFVHPNSHPFDSDLVCCNEAGNVTGFDHDKQARNTDYENLVNAGLMIFSPDVFQLIPAPRKMSLEKDLVETAIQTGKMVVAYRSTEYIKDVGTPERLLESQLEWQKGKIALRNLKNRQKAIFLDRDGTINSFVGLLTKPEQMRLIDGTAEAIRMINRSEYLAIIVTNQPVIARGDCTLEELRNIHKRLYTILGAEGAYVDDLVFCPHHPDRGFPGENPTYKINCDCRKPKPGMLVEMENRYNIDLSQSWMIGDTWRDIETGKNAGTKTALIRSEVTGNDINAQPDLKCQSLLQAIRIIFESSE